MSPIALEAAKLSAAFRPPGTKTRSNTSFSEISDSKHSGDIFIAVRPSTGLMSSECEKVIAQIVTLYV